ncbi:MAG: hypothetical protein IJZ53_00830 [Tyzzerella sp.]|nr:hypothetical protein [Tyzzerella sp.]
MKKFTKIALIVAAVMAGIGVISLLVSSALGLSIDVFNDMVENGKLGFKFINSSIIRTEESKSSAEIDEKCENLDIEYGAGVLKIYYDDVEQIQIKQKNVTRFESHVEDETLYIEGGKGANSNSDATLEVILPKNMMFEEVDFELGASKADIVGLKADTMNVEVGAGEADISSLDVKNLNAETGVGKLSVELIGKESDYSYSLECGIGAIQMGNSSYGGLGTEKKITNPGANRFVDVECGIGEIEIDFTE